MGGVGWKCHTMGSPGSWGAPSPEGEASSSSPGGGRRGAARGVGGRFSARSSEGAIKHASATRRAPCNSRRRPWSCCAGWGGGGRGGGGGRSSRGGGSATKQPPLTRTHLVRHPQRRVAEHGEAIRGHHLHVEHSLHACVVRGWVCGQGRARLQAARAPARSLAHEPHTARPARTSHPTPTHPPARPPTFIAGSSKQGKAVRAELASSWVAARYCGVVLPARV